MKRRPAVDTEIQRRPGLSTLGRRGALTSALAAVLIGGSGLFGPVSVVSAQPNLRVIVTSDRTETAAGSVLAAGGTVVRSLSVINGVEASVPPKAVAELQAVPGITVTDDVAVNTESTTVDSAAPHTPTDIFREQTGASTLATTGDTGQGVTVAVLDTGIDALPDFAGRLIGGVDFTGAQKPFDDEYGHGTFVAGLIAGNGQSSSGQFSGEATGSNLVAIKVAGASGATDLATVIAGVQWAIDNEARYRIRVLNMSLGVQPASSTVDDPLDRAVEAAWQSGITVVTPAGNSGPSSGTILSPGDDPLVVTVGALDDMAQPSVADDEINDFSSVGPTVPDGWAKPDLVTSGRSVVSLAAPGSTIDDDYPSGRIGSGNFVGSGTSFSTAITSGAAALILEQHPTLDPNEVKARLIGTTDPGPGASPYVDGHGALNAEAAVDAGPMDIDQSSPYDPGAQVGDGSPSSGSAWNGSAWNGSAWNGSAWNGSAWNGSAWNGSAWNGSAWNGSAWNVSAWSGAEWNWTAWTELGWS